MTPQNTAPAPPAAPKVSVVQPERNAWHPLELAEQRVSGIHVPTGLIVRHKKPGTIMAECQTIIKEVKSFYKELGYIVLGQEKGFKIVPSKKTLEQMPEKQRALAAQSEVFIFKGRNRWWTFQFHVPETRLEKVARTDPMDYIDQPIIPAEIEAKRSGKPRIVGGDLQATPTRKAPRRYDPSRIIDIRPRLKAWMEENKGKQFID
jgi:hypothetical protein